MLDGAEGRAMTRPLPGDAARRDRRLRRRGPATLAHDPLGARDRVVRDQRVAGDRGRPGRSSASTTSSARAPAATRSSTSCSPAARRSRSTASRSPRRPARSSSSRIRRRGAAPSPTRRRPTILVIGGRPGRRLLGLAVGALGRGAALLDDGRLGPRDRGARGAARRGSRQRERPLQPRLRREPLRPSRRRARPPGAGGRARAALRRARARRHRPRRDSRRRPLPARLPTG